MYNSACGQWIIPPTTLSTYDTQIIRTSIFNEIGNEDFLKF